MSTQRLGVALGALAALWLWSTGYLAGERAALLRERDRLIAEGAALEERGRLVMQTLTHTELAPTESWFERPAPRLTLTPGVGTTTLEWTGPALVSDGSGRVWPSAGIELAPLGSDVEAGR